MTNDVILINNNINANYTFLRNLTPAAYIFTAINLLLGVAGVAAFIFLLLGGIQWITAGADKDALDKARKRLIQALIGLAIVFSAYAIIYILRVLFNVNIIGFTLRRLGT
jgi:Type IV secretion system pilin